jgi:serine-type D-Ala-D-Ala carboxypeptidase/endopeptidase (penicillin-binding protein 4)
MMIVVTVVLILFTVSGNTYFNDVHAIEEGSELAKRLNEIIMSEPQLQGSLTGVSIRSATTGEILYDHIGDTRLSPASNLKLFTSAAALSVLGESYQFKTQLLTDGDVNDSTLNGNLYIKGSGDPTLLKEDLDKMAETLRKKGIKKINGHLIGDDSYYDSVRYSMDLPWSDETTYYGAQISALTASPDKDYDAGTIIVEVVPGKQVNDKALIKLTPNTDYIVIKNDTKTINHKGKHIINIEREHGKNNIHISGSIPLESKTVKEWISVWEPTEYTLYLLKSSLSSKGIEMNGKIKTGATAKNSSVLVEHQSMTLSNLLIPFMKLSNNGHGETLIKAMGKMKNDEGSWDAGIKVVKDELKQMDIDTETLVIRDGSGISHVNLVTTNEVTNLLYKAQSKTWFPSFFESLPVSGFSERFLGGTLRYRLSSPTLLGKVRAKTGSISTVSSLSGYIETKTGERLIFSIIVNNLLDETIGKEIEDKIVNTIYEHYQ